VVRGFLGVVIQDMNAEVARELGIDISRAGSLRGVYVKEVMEHSPAAAGGMAAGDIIVEINHQEMINVPHLRSVVAMLPVDQPADVTVIRKGGEEQLKVVIGAKPEEKTAAIASRTLFGMAVETLTPQQAARDGNPALQGVRVVGIEKGGPAEAAGIEVNDVIIKVGRNEVADVLAFEREAAKFNLAEGIPLVVYDGTGTTAVELKEAP